ncbi:MAG: MerR family transcriptional regulator [Rhodococcus sp. (in: high G+C Gram-positive bacteria)]
MPEAFGPGALRLGLTDCGGGYRVPAVQQASGVTYRQLDYWARTGLVGPSIKSAAGSGSARLYSFSDIVMVRVIKRLLDAGVSLQNVRVAVKHLRGRGVQDLAAVTLVCDGVSVYECTTDDQIIDLLRGGQGVFGIAIGHTTADIAAAVTQLPSVDVDTAPDGLPGAETTNDSADTRVIADELSTRRSRRRSA